jgi:hypothetical protein
MLPSRPARALARAIPLGALLAGATATAAVAQAARGEAAVQVSASVVKYQKIDLAAGTITETPAKPASVTVDRASFFRGGETIERGNATAQIFGDTADLPDPPGALLGNAGWGKVAYAKAVATADRPGGYGKAKLLTLGFLNFQNTSETEIWSVFLDFDWRLVAIATGDGTPNAASFAYASVGVELSSFCDPRPSPFDPDQACPPDALPDDAAQFVADYRMFTYRPGGAADVPGERKGVQLFLPRKTDGKTTTISVALAASVEGWAVVPEPSSLSLLGTGAGALAVAWRRRRARS